MRTLAIAMLAACAACGGGGGGGGSSREIVSQLHYCGYYDIRNPDEPVYVSGFDLTYYADDPFTAVVEDDWGLVRVGEPDATDWVIDWRRYGGEEGVCLIPGRPPESAVEDVWWLDLKDGQEVYVSDLDAFLATHH